MLWQYFAMTELYFRTVGEVTALFRANSGTFDSKEVFMFELFMMSLREYWGEMSDGTADVSSSIAELQEVLSQHYEKEVKWDEPEEVPVTDEEVDVDIIDDRQISALHVVAAKMVVDGNLDGLELDPEEPWENEALDKLAEKADDEDLDDRFCHLLAIGNSSECICLPVDLPFVAQININDDEDGEEEKCCCKCDDHECDCDDDCCCCCDEDEGIDISSLVALRRELDDIGKVLGIDSSINVDECEKIAFDEEDDLRYAKVGWYILSTRVDVALENKQPLIIRFVDDEEYDLDEDADEE